MRRIALGVFPTHIYLLLEQLFVGKGERERSSVGCPLGSENQQTSNQKPQHGPLQRAHSSLTRGDKCCHSTGIPLHWQRFISSPTGSHRNDNIAQQQQIPLIKQNQETIYSMDRAKTSLLFLTLSLNIVWWYHLLEYSSVIIRVIKGMLEFWQNYSNITDGFPVFKSAAFVLV